jgi:signal peptidase II
LKARSKIVFYLTFILSFFIDRILKFLINIQIPENSSIEIYKYFFITNIKNRGILFGLLNNGNYVFILILFSIVALLLIFFFVHRMSVLLPDLTVISFGLIAGGILGNLFDRIRYHAVIDYIDFRVWPVFNLADCFIVSGVCLYIIKQFWRQNASCIF